MSAGHDAFVTPGLAAVEFGNQHQELTGGGIDVSGELGEVVFEFLRRQGSKVRYYFLPVNILFIIPVNTKRVWRKYSQRINFLRGSVILPG